MNTSDKLAKLYKEIYACNKCQKVYKSETVRKVPEFCDSEIVFMAQAPAEHGIRKSGLHWIKKDKTLTNGGVRLNPFLEKIGYTVNPSNNSLPRPYTTNAIHCFPGRNSKGDHKLPGKNSAKNCESWWLKELQIIHPKVLVLLGRIASNHVASMKGINATFRELRKNYQEGIKFNYGADELTCFFLLHPTAHENISDSYKNVFDQIEQILKN
jgi:uracil-DNA glycosylase family 4